MLIDSHCHLNFYEPEEVGGIISRAQANGVEKFINIGTSLSDSELAVKQAEQFDNVYATVGLHPNDNIDVTVETIDWDKFETLAKSPKVVAIGECGLDFSRLSAADPKLQQVEKERQTKLFIQQIKIAHKLDLPLSFHIRDSYEKILDLLGQVPHPLRAVFHCMSGTPQYLQALLELMPKLEPYFSFAGNITFKNAESIRQLAQLVPLDKLLIETDCPFLAPQPMRGSKNEPANVRIVAERLAEVKGISLEEISRITSENTQKLFKIPK